jgi:hypothetical protein
MRCQAYKPSHMKKYYLTVQLSLLAALLLTGFAGCLKTSSWHTYKIYTPIYESISTLRAEVKSEAPRSLSDPGKLYIMGNRIYLNERKKGIHVIDNSNPRLPRNLAFINVPGNIDIAMKGDVLYADMYSDLTAIDVSDPAAVAVKKSLTNAFVSVSVKGSNSSNPDSVFVITSMNSHDTTVNEDALVYNSAAPSFQSFSSSSPAATGTAGSMARPFFAQHRQCDCGGQPAAGKPGDNGRQCRNAVPV